MKQCEKCRGTGTVEVHMPSGDGHGGLNGGGWVACQCDVCKGRGVVDHA